MVARRSPHADSNPEVDKLIDQQSAEPDREKRKPLRGFHPARNRKFADSPLERDGFELPVPRYPRWSRLSPKCAIRAEGNGRIGVRFDSLQGRELGFDFRLTGCGSKALSLVCRQSGDRPVRTRRARIDAAGRRRSRGNGRGNGGAPGHGVELVGLPARCCPRCGLERSGPASGPACDP